MTRPAEWRRVPLGKVVTFQRGFDITKDHQEAGPYPVYTSSGPTSSHSEFMANGPGVIIGRKGSLGTVFFSDGDYWPHDTTLWVRDFHGNLPRFVYYYLQTLRLERYDAGASNPSLNRNHVHTIDVAWPGRAIQSRVAEILSAYDELIANSLRRIQILEEMARAIYREWFVHFRFPGHEGVRHLDSALGRIPQGWRVATVGELASFLSRGITPIYDENGQSLIINQKCVRDQRLSLEPARRQRKPVPTEKRVRFGDVLINSTGVGTLGRVAQVYDHLENCTIDTHVTIARAPNAINIDWWGSSLLHLQPEFERLGMGATGQTELGLEAIARLQLALPVQSVIGHFGELVRPTRTLGIVLSRQVANLRATRDLLLPRLMSGRLTLPKAEEVVPTSL
jgi:type I restriction enzyme, S subunit